MKTKQIAYLRSLGQTLQPSVRIGKMGLTSDVESSAAAALAANELIKVRVLNKTSPIDTKDALLELAEKLGAVMVQVIGHNGLLYRRNEKKPKIEIPS